MTATPMAALRRGASPRRSGFSLVEVIVAMAIGIVVLVGALYLWSFGTKSFYKTTEHVAFRQEALLILERVARDFEQIVVAPGMDNPVNGEPSILSPFVLDQPYDLDYENPNDPTGPKIRVKASKTGITFFRFHRVEYDTADPDAPDNGIGMPKMVARKVEYRVEDVPDGGKNLIRNGVKVNTQPIDTVLFHREPPIVTGSQVKGSPNAIVSVTVVPKGGIKGHMGSTKDTVTREILEVLRKKSSVVERTFHLVGYESMYTNLLYRALQVTRRYLDEQNQSFDFGNVTSNYAAAIDAHVKGNEDKDLLKDVFKDAYLNPDTAGQTSQAMLEKLTYGVGNNAGKAFAFPKQVFLLEDQLFVESDSAAFTDPTWTGAGTSTPPPPWLDPNINTSLQVDENGNVVFDAAGNPLDVNGQPLYFDIEGNPVPAPPPPPPGSAGSGTATPPAGSGSATPPAGSGTATPPAGSGTAN